MRVERVKRVSSDGSGTSRCRKGAPRCRETPARTAGRKGLADCCPTLAAWAVGRRHLCPSSAAARGPPYALADALMPYAKRDYGRALALLAPLAQTGKRRRTVEAWDDLLARKDGVARPCRRAGMVHQGGGAGPG